MRNTNLRNLVDLLINLALVYAAYAVCRLLFIGLNHSLYPDLTMGHAFGLLCAGLIFDSSAICYTNIVVIAMFLLPLRRKECYPYYRVAQWIYTITNGLCIIANLADIVYFPYTGRRTTGSVFSEFSHEGAGNMLKIFYDQTVAHWPLLLVAIALIAGLWLGYRNPQRRHTASQPLWLYYGLGIAIFGVFGYGCWGMMRGGFTHATRPITISNANKYAKTPAEAAVVLNTPFSLIRTFNKKSFVTPNYMSQAEAQRIFPTLRPAPQELADSLHGIARGMNVVVMIMESYSKQHIGYYNARHGENGPEGRKESYTPFLDSLLASGTALTYRYSYANGRKSIEAMPSVLSSIPNYVEPFFLTPASMNHLSGLARELSDHQGYRSAFFHGAENGSMGFEAFANATGFQRYYGRTEYNASPKYHGDDDFDGTWAIYDEEFMQFFADELDRMEQPFVAALFTATSHTPFKIPERYAGRFPKSDIPLQECVAYTDHAMRLFFDRARREPWFDRTVFVITADHVSGQADPYYLSVLGHYSVPIVIYAPGLPQIGGYDRKRIAQQIDIMPTVLGLLGYEQPYIAFGQNLLSTPPADTYALHWVPEFGGYELVKGGYVMRFDGQGVTAVYDYRSDPLQQTDIKESMNAGVRSAMETELKAIIQQYMYSMNADSLTIR